MMINNDNLGVNDCTLIDNGGSNSHGVTVYWDNGKLITKFVTPEGYSWVVSEKCAWLLAFGVAYTDYKQVAISVMELCV